MESYNKPHQTISLSHLMKSEGWGAILYANKTICFQKQKPLSGEKAASLKTFSIYIMSLNKEVLILAMEWIKCVILPTK